MGQKKKKEKIVYYDDGRSVADMSNVQAGPRLKSTWRPKSERKAIRQTYWNAVKKMFVPMLVVICAICIIYMILYAVFLFMY